MPRYSRRKCATNVYHVILRGINQQELFLEKSDYQKFLKDIRETKTKYDYEVYAYVLMNNHVHMLIYDKSNLLSKILQSLTIRYSLYFNRKYQRIGHLFQNRFLSKNVEDTAYLLTLQRYIHQNPVKEKMDSIEKYQWSSYQEYIGKSNIVNTQFILSLFSKDKQRAILLFKNFNNVIKQEYKMEYELKNSYTDDEMIKLIKEITKESNLMKIQSYNKKERNRTIREILNIEGTTATQLARILGINKRTVQRIAKMDID